VGVDATGIWGEGVCVIHGEICLFANSAITAVRR